MKKRKIIFLRHAETEKNPDLNAALWDLSNQGKIEAKNLANLEVMSQIDSIYSSQEKKAILTAEPIAKKLKREINPLSFFNEIKRGDKFLSKEDFEKEKIKQLTDLDYHAFNGESGSQALSRFKQGIEYILEKDGETLLIVSHGTILNIYFANLLNLYNQLPQRWQKTSFSAYGITENGIVVKDIV